MTRPYDHILTPNSKRCELGALGVHPVLRARFKLNSKRAHPPIPPRGRALSLRPRELEARARFKFALRVQNRGGRGRRRLGTPAGSRSDDVRGNSTQYTKTFFPVRSGFWQEVASA